MDFEELCEVWARSRWTITRRDGWVSATRRPLYGSRRYPRASVMFDGEEAVATVELWADRAKGAPRFPRQWGSPGFKNVVDAMARMDADVPRLLEKASAKARREKGGA